MYHSVVQRTIVCILLPQNKLTEVKVEVFLFE